MGFDPVLASSLSLQAVLSAAGASCTTGIGGHWKYLCRVQGREGLAVGMGCGHVLSVPGHHSCCCGTDRHALEAEPHRGHQPCCCS